jgi:hypothetical protein
VGVEETSWIVLRFSDDMPLEYRPPDLDGLWMPRDQAPRAQSIEAARKAAESHENEHLVGECVAVPTDRFEERTVLEGTEAVVPDAWRESYRGPGGKAFVLQKAQVYEIRPLWKIDESW